VTGMNPHIAYKTITVILDKDGTATEIAKKLKKDHSLLTGNIQNARGTGDPSSKRSFLNQLEKDLFTVVVPEDQADEIFALMYDECQMGSRFGGFMYQAHLSQLSKFTLPDLDEQ
jgi:hypothetical protein